MTIALPASNNATTGHGLEEESKPVKEWSPFGDLFQKEPFASASCHKIGIWSRLVDYCARQGNGGIIKDAESWSNARWLSAIKVNGHDVRKTLNAAQMDARDDPKTELWVWRPWGDLCIKFYLWREEIAARDRSEKASKAARTRWQKQKIEKPNSVPECSSICSSIAPSSELGVHQLAAVVENAAEEGQIGIFVPFERPERPVPVQRESA